MKIANPPEKSHPLFSSNSPLKVEVLSSPPLVGGSTWVKNNTLAVKKLESDYWLLYCKVHTNWKNLTLRFNKHLNERELQCTFLELTWTKAATRCVIKKSVLQNFTIFTRKHQCSSLFLIKLQAFKKSDFNTDISLLIFRNFKEHIFWITSASAWRQTSVKNIHFSLKTSKVK